MKNEHVRVVILRNDGGISVMHFLTKARLQPGGHALDHWDAETIPGVEMVRTVVEKGGRVNGKKVDKQTVVDIPKPVRVPTGWFTREASEANIADEIRRSNIDYVSFQIAKDSEIPTDRTFRGAWSHCPKKKIRVDMDKARDIHMSRIREARNTKLAELDKRKYGPEFDAHRQKLRDLPQTLDLSKAKTPEELKTLWPDDLK